MLGVKVIMEDLEDVCEEHSKDLNSLELGGLSPCSSDVDA